MPQSVLLARKNPWLKYLPVLVSALFAIFCFDQGFDMKITMLHSSELIDALRSGEKFYARVWAIAQETGFLGYPAEKSGAIYNVMVYLTMAVWALPVYLLNQLVHFSPETYTEILNLWGRVLVIALCLVTASQLSRLAKEIFHREGSEHELPWDQDVRYLFLSSPILLCEAIVLNQYDIFMVLTMVIALRFFFQNRMVLFSLLMSLSICYKLFAVIAFVPLLLVKEKRFWRILGYALIGASVYGITTLACARLDPGYAATQEVMGRQFGYSSWIYAKMMPGGFSDVYIFILGYLLLCFFAFMHHPDPDREKEAEFSLWLGLAAYVLFFCFVNWHPQWIVLLVPFVALLFGSVRQRETALLADLVLSLGYLAVCIDRWMDNCFLVDTLFQRVFHMRYPIDMNPVKFLLNYYGAGRIWLMTVMEAGMLFFLIAAWRGLRGKHTLLEHEGNGRWVDFLFRVRSLELFLFTLPPIIQVFRSQR